MGTAFVNDVVDMEGWQIRNKMKQRVSCEPDAINPVSELEYPYSPEPEKSEQSDDQCTYRYLPHASCAHPETY